MEQSTTHSNLEMPNKVMLEVFDATSEGFTRDGITNHKAGFGSMNCIIFTLII